MPLTNPKNIQYFTLFSGALLKEQYRLLKCKQGLCLKSPSLQGGEVRKRSECDNQLLQIADEADLEAVQVQGGHGARDRSHKDEEKFDVPTQ